MIIIYSPDTVNIALIVQANHVLFLDRWFNPFVHQQVLLFRITRVVNPSYDHTMTGYRSCPPHRTNERCNTHSLERDTTPTI